MRGLFFDTLSALVAPRRAIPVLVIAVPLLVAQHEFSAEPRALPLAVLMIVLSVVVAPFSFRVLFPLELRGGLVFRVLIYAALGLLVPLVAWGLPPLLGFERSFLSSRANVGVAIGLFWVGGFGLGRDIELEARWQSEKQRAEKLSAEAERAQLLALRANLDPHFLFNTLNAIAEWCREDAEVAERAILGLASMLREILSGVQSPLWPLSRELALVESLFELHKMRDPERFSASISASPESMSMEIPALLLLPLAENAMKHGPAKGNRGQISLQVETVGGEVKILLENPGAFTGRRAGGQGLDSVEKRLRLAFGEKARLAIENIEGRARTRATVTLPREYKNV